MCVIPAFFLYIHCKQNYFWFHATLATA